jgi:hypothetical protein
MRDAMLPRKPLPKDPTPTPAPANLPEKGPLVKPTPRPS